MGKLVLHKAAMKGDLAAMGAYADYLEEHNGNQSLIVGLRFCVRYKKFPGYSDFHVDYNKHAWWWRTLNGRDSLRIAEGKNTLPVCMEPLSYPTYRTANDAIRALGKTIIKIDKFFKEIL